MLATACASRRPCPLQCHQTLRTYGATSGATRHFHPSARHRDDDFPNHYETLGVPLRATEKEIKKQFYALSKSHHPDLHPNDPDASKRFVRISEAYAVLSAPTKRAAYDRDHARVFQQARVAQGQAYPSGSFSSAAANGPGGRPASGLSRRRTQFRGPPPSFYQSGGYGAQGDKRSDYASQASHAWESRAANEEEGSANDASAGMPGMGPGGFAQGLENDVPHFDSRGHYQTHSTIERTRHRARRRVQQQVEEAGNGSNVYIGFFTISGILLLGIGASGVMKSS